ncbi:MAG: tetratricopeptide repeat protein [Bryobacteraceae bacterium]
MRLLGLLLAAGLLWSTSPVASGATFEELAAQAAAAREANNVPQAMDLYRQALQLKPEWPEGWWYLGTLAYDSDQYPIGRDAFSNFVKLQSQDAPGWSFLGLCEFETGDYAHSLEHIDRGLKLAAGGMEPGITNVLQFHEALLLVKQGLFDRALPLFLPIVKGGSKDPTLAIALGLASLRRPQLPQEVPADERELVSAAGKVTYLWMNGDSSNVDPAFRALVGAYPTARNVHYLYGTFLLSTNPEQALAQFRMELGINKHSADANAMISLLLIRAGRDDVALSMAQQAVEDGESTPMAHFVYGVLLTRQGELARGIEHLEKAQKLDPNNLEYHIALAGAYSKLGRNEEARRERLTSIALAKQ